MAGYLRLRQICLVAPALGPAEEDITALLGVPVPVCKHLYLQGILWTMQEIV